MKTIIKSFAGAVAGTILVLLIAFFVTKQQQPEQTATIVKKQIQKLPEVKASYLLPQNTDFTTAAAKSVNAVVHIKTIIGIKPRNYDNFFGSLRDYLYGQRQQALIAFGSGVVISPNGYIVTNNHVVNGADKIIVTFNDKQEMEARIIGTSPSTDLALIKVDAKDLPYLTYGNSDNLKVGQWVLAVGNPFNLTSTVTAGIISAKARDIHILGGKTAIESFIQTDAAVNPGNSGGALVNTAGQLIGINAAIASQTGAYEGYSFAIPVNLVRKVVNDLMNYGQIQRAYLGVQIQNIDAAFAKKMDLHDLNGVYVAMVVEGSGADKAGIKKGDIITAINGRPAKDISVLLGIIGQYSPGKVVRVNLLRNRKKKTVRVTLKNKNGTTGLIKAQKAFYSDALGAMLKTAPENDLTNLNIDHGLEVVRVRKGILQKGGITEGFIITEVNKRKVNNKEQIKRALSQNNNHVVKVSGIYPNGMRISFEFVP
ncbi:MAG: serine protease [bacterium]|nr:MAG: serine protease [bacterium]